MNWLDIVLIAAIVINTVVGFAKGLIQAALPLIGLVVGVILAGRFYIPLAELLKFIPDTGIARVVAFALIVIAVLVISVLLAKLLKAVTRVTLLGWLDHLGGGVLGFLSGAIICAAALTIWLKFMGTGEIIEPSSVATFLLDRFPLVLGLLPSEFDSIRDFFR